jgi:hypothetical protein
MTLRWTLAGHGWIRCVVADRHSQAEAIVSDITDGIEQLLHAVASLCYDERPVRAEFEAEPTVYRWIFHRRGAEVDIRLLEVADHQLPDHAGTTIWASRQSIDGLARTVVRSFDQLRTDHSDDSYQAQWGRPFPHGKLDALRTAWRRTRDAGPDQPPNGAGTANRGSQR